MPPKTPLVDPYSYFAERTNALASGAIVFGLHVLGDLLLLVLVVRAIMRRVDVAVPTDAWTSVLGPIVFFALVMYAIAWLVVAAVMHYLGGGSNADGTFSDALAVAGWAYAPEVLALPLHWLLVRREIASLQLEGVSTEAAMAELEAVQSGVFGLPDLVLLLAITGFSVYVLAYGVAGTHDVPVGETLGPAVIVGVGSIVLTLLGAT